MTREDKVEQFLVAANKKKFNMEDPYDFSMENNFCEEAEELLDAIEDYVENPTEKTRANLCKEWSDVQVTLSNIAWYFNIPADEAFNRVHENNMTKLIDGKVRRRADGKILKPEGYVKPDMKGL